MSKKIHLLNYMIFIILILSVILDVKLNIPETYKVPAADIIITLMPLIFTIITISLSLPSEKIYGVSMNVFRKIRKDNHYSFLEMIIITIIIFIFYTIFSILRFTISIWFLDVIAIVFSIEFISQEIPILVKSDKKLIKILKKTWALETNEDYKNGNISNGKELYSILQYIVVNQGIIETFNSFKTANTRKNSSIFDSLLLINNAFLADCFSKNEYITSSSLITYNGINILNAIDVSLNSFCDLLSFRDDFDIVAIYGDSEHYYQIMNMLFCLHKLTKKLNLVDKFEEKISDSLRYLTFSSSIKKEQMKFIYHFLNNMLIYSLSENDLWFVRLLRDSELYSSYSLNNYKPYFLFLIIYLFYIEKVDKKVPEPLKISLISMLDEQSKGINSDGINLYSLIDIFFEFNDLKTLFSLLKETIFIFKNENRNLPWYMPSNCRSWSSSEGEFDEELILNCWIALVVYNYHRYQFDIDSAREAINSLEESDQYALAYCLNKNWFNNNQFIGLPIINELIEMYKLKTFFDSVHSDDQIIDFFKEEKQRILYKEYEHSADNSKILTRQECIDIKEKVMNLFNNAKRNIDVYDEHLSIKNKKEYCYRARFEISNYERMIELYMNRINYSFKKIIGDNISKLVQPKKDINRNTLIKRLNNYNFRSGFEYILLDYGFEINDIESLRTIAKSNLNLSSFYVWKNGAIKFNIECDGEKSFVRPVNDSEINSIIDNEYKVLDGLYKYNDGDNNKSIFITRSEVYDFIKNKYFNLCIVFRYEINLDRRKIVRIDSKSEKV